MSAPNPVKSLADLLIFQQRLRQASSTGDLLQVLVNDSRQLVSFRSAVFWDRHRVSAVSGLPEPVRNASFTQWVEGFCRQGKIADCEESIELGPEDVDERFRRDWAGYLPGRVLCLNLPAADSGSLGILLLAREEPWRKEEKRVLKHVVPAAAHALEALQLRRKSLWSRISAKGRRRIWLGAAALVLALLLVPVRMSVIAAAEVVPASPWAVRSQQDGVIGSVLATPNQPVDSGQLLLRLDDSELNTRLDVAIQELDVARAELLRAEQASIADRRASAQFHTLNSRIEQRQAEVEYIRTLLDRVEIRAEREGIAIIDDITELVGRPVRLGEKIMTIADPDDIAIEAWMPVDDSVPLEQGDALRMFLNVAPATPVPARIERIDYQAGISPDGILAFRVRAAIDDGSVPRIGLRGSARIYGDKVSLFYYLFRKPLAWVRQTLGL